MSQFINNDSIDYQPFFQAALNGDFDTIRRYYKVLKADLDKRDLGGMTALHHACARRHLKIVKYLIHKNATVNIRNEINKCPLDYLSHHDLKREITDFIFWRSPEGKIKYLQENVDTTKPSIHQFAHGGRLEDLQRCVARDPACVNLQDVRGNTPIMFALIGNQMKSVEFLLDSGSDISIKNHVGMDGYQFTRGEQHKRHVRQMVLFFAAEEKGRRRREEQAAARAETERLLMEEKNRQDREARAARLARERRQIEANTIRRTAGEYVRKGFKMANRRVCLRLVEEEERLSAEAEAARLAAEELERRRRDEEAVALSLHRLRLQREAEAEAKRLQLEELERLEQLRLAEERRLKELEKRRLFEKEKRRIEAELLANIRYEQKLLDDLRQQEMKDVANRPFKIAFVNRMRQAMGRI